MNICTKQNQIRPLPKLIFGHLYQRISTGEIFLCAYENRLVGVETGHGWSGREGFGSTSDWEDVTDQYCLQKVK